MADDIVISSLGSRTFQVRVRSRSRSRETTHEVTVPQPLPGGLQLPDGDLERLVRESFDFLLQREHPSSILARFSLDDISRYFPEYPEEIARRIG